MDVVDVMRPRFDFRELRRRVGGRGGQHRVSLRVRKRVQRHVVVPLETKELADERSFQWRKAIGEGTVSEGSEPMGSSYAAGTPSQ